MDYGTLKQNIIDLGFSDEDELEEFGALVPNSINRAITDISMSVSPIISHIDVTPKELSGEDELIEIVMPGDFMKFTDIPVKRNLSKGVYKRFNDFEIENGNTVIMSGSIEGTYRIFYVSDHTPFTLDTEDTAVIPLPLKVHYLLPLLSSYYIWLDDDMTKAQEYYARYQQAIQAMNAENVKPKGRVITDWSGSRWL